MNIIVENQPYNVRPFHKRDIFDHFQNSEMRCSSSNIVYNMVGFKRLSNFVFQYLRNNIYYYIVIKNDLNVNGEPVGEKLVTNINKIDRECYSTIIDTFKDFGYDTVVHSKHAIYSYDIDSLIFVGKLPYKEISSYLPFMEGAF